jgi:hypothetical protein
VTAKLAAAAHLKEIERLHGVAAEKLGLGEATLAAQAAYHAQLSGQFARAEKKAPAPVARRKKV